MRPSQIRTLVPRRNQGRFAGRLQGLSGEGRVSAFARHGGDCALVWLATGCRYRQAEAWPVVGAGRERICGLRFF